MTEKETISEVEGNRDFCFRAWDKKRNKMYSNVSFDADYYHQAQVRSPDIDSLQFVQKDNCIIMQNTGFVDMDGVRIWEHDLVRTRNGKLAIVVFKKGSFILEFAGDDRCDEYLSYGVEIGIRVEGNAYGW